MLFLILACNRNDYFSAGEAIQFSISDSEVVELETLTDNSLSYRHRPSCDIGYNLSSLNLGDSEATLLLQSDVHEVAQQITIPPSEGGNRHWYSASLQPIPCRDKSYFATITASNVSEVLVEFHAEVRATLVEPGDLGAMNLSVPRVELSAESFVLSHTGEE